MVRPVAVSRCVGADLGHLLGGGRAEDPVVAGGRHALGRLGEAADAAGVAGGRGRDGPLVPPVEGVLRGEAGPLRARSGPAAGRPGCRRGRAAASTRLGRSGVEWRAGSQWRRRSVWSAQATGPVGPEGGGGVGPLGQDRRPGRPERRPGGGRQEGPGVARRKRGADRHRGEGAPAHRHLPEDDLLPGVRVEPDRSPAGQDAERPPLREGQRSAGRADDVAARPGGGEEVGGGRRRPPFRRRRTVGTWRGCADFIAPTACRRPEAPCP